jgi:hypothetical protein
VQRRLAAGAVERAAQNLAVDRYNPFALLGEAGHEPLKRRAELLRVEHAEKPAERIVAGHAILELEKLAASSAAAFRERRSARTTPGSRSSS